jgi:hypothetical protein
MHRFAVYKELAIIFNCSFESSKSGKIGKLFVETGLCEIHDFALTTPALTTVAAYLAMRLVCYQSYPEERLQRAGRQDWAQRRAQRRVRRGNPIRAKAQEG